MKTDLLLIPMSARYRDMRAAAIAAEEAGFDGLWTWDHLRDPDGESGPGVPEAWTTLTALAEATRHRARAARAERGESPSGLLANMAPRSSVSGGAAARHRRGGSQRTPYAAEQRAIGQSVERDEVRARKVVEAIGSCAGSVRPRRISEIGAPPPIVGGFGPRMAGIAGRYDGLLPRRCIPSSGAARVACEEHVKSGRPADFVLTVFAGLTIAFRADSPRPPDFGRRRRPAILLTAPHPKETRAIIRRHAVAAVGGVCRPASGAFDGVRMSRIGADLFVPRAFQRHVEPHPPDSRISKPRPRRSQGPALRDRAARMRSPELSVMIVVANSTAGHQVLHVVGVVVVTELAIDPELYVDVAGFDLVDVAMYARSARTCRTR
jgi:hypothetical protein